MNGISVHYPDGFFLCVNTKSIDINELVNIAFNKFNLSIMEDSHFSTEGKDYIRFNCALDIESLNEELVRLVNLFNYFKDR